MQNTVPRALVGFSIGFDSNSPQVLVVAKMDGPCLHPKRDCHPILENPLTRLFKIAGLFFLRVINRYFDAVIRVIYQWTFTLHSSKKSLLTGDFEPFLRSLLVPNSHSV